MGSVISAWHAKPGLSQARILLCSDTHGYKDSLDAFLSYLSTKNLHYDLVIHSGDFSSIKSEDHADPSKEAQALDSALLTLKALESLLHCPVVYIPGNHEANSMYTHSSITAHSINLHKTSIKVDDKLAIIGFGGAPPGIKEEKDTWTQVWEGCPQSTHEAFDKDVVEFFDSEIAKYSSDINFLVLTHCGPWNIQTTVSPSGTQTGSKGITNVLQKYNKQILCMVHGHTHDCPGMTKQYYSECMVINPGPIIMGKFTELVVEKVEGEKWRICEVKFVTI